MVLDSAERKVIEDVERFGWHVMKVAPRSGSDDPEEWFAYTIGLTKTYGWPEIICFGLATDAMAKMLNNAVDECRDRKLAPTTGLELTEVVTGYPTRLVENSDIPDHYFGFGIWFARHCGLQEPPSRLQLLWPDKDGHFPDKPECSPEVRRLQSPVEKK